jgi:hypothetical protein
MSGAAAAHAAAAPAGASLLEDILGEDGAAEWDGKARHSKSWVDGDTGRGR